MVEATWPSTHMTPLEVLDLIRGTCPEEPSHLVGCLYPAAVAVVLLTWNQMIA